MDRKTKKYFDKNLPSYSIVPYKAILKFLTKKKASLLDIGCADGSGLAFISKNRKYQIYGLESSSAYQSKQMSGLKVYNFSVLDKKKCMKLKNKFDYILILRVLHHLVDRNVSSSRMLERKAIDNAMTMLKNGGKLLIAEPIYNPSLFNTIVFYLKKTVSLFSEKRIHLGGYRFNIGLPIVNYFSISTAKKFFSKYCVEEISVKLENKGMLSKLTKRSDAVIVLKK